MIERPQISDLEILKSIEEGKFDVAQAQFIRGLLGNLRLRQIIVDPRPKMIPASEFEQKKVLALASFEESSVAMLAGTSYKNESEVMLVVVPPKPESSSLLVDDETNRFYIDDFWVCQDSVFKHIKTNRPVPVDMVNFQYGGDRDDMALLKGYEAYWGFHSVALNKQLTREALERAGIPIPKGIYFDDQDTDPMGKLDQFFADNPHISTIVDKTVEGSQGNNVVFFPPDKHMDLREVVYDQVFSGKERFVLEERIVPIQVEGLGYKLPKKGKKFVVDYNFRVLTTIDPTNPAVIDAEIRSKRNDDDVVNISKGAKATRVSAINRPDLVAKVFDIAVQGTKAIAGQVTYEGETISGIAGWDIILDQDGNPLVLEVNSGNVGGFGTLTRLDRKPLECIEKVLIPALLPNLEASFTQRKDPKVLRRVKLGEHDKVSLYAIFMKLGRYEEAQELFVEFGPKHFYHHDFLMGLFAIAKQSGDFRLLEDIVTDGLENSEYYKDTYEDLQRLIAEHREQKKSNKEDKKD